MYPRWIQLEGKDGATVYNHEQEMAYVRDWELSRAKKAEPVAVAAPIVPVEKTEKRPTVKSTWQKRGRY